MHGPVEPRDSVITRGYLHPSKHAVDANGVCGLAVHRDRPTWSPRVHEDDETRAFGLDGGNHSVWEKLVYDRRCKPRIPTVAHRRGELAGIKGRPRLTGHFGNAFESDWSKAFGVGEDQWLGKRTNSLKGD